MVLIGVICGEWCVRQGEPAAWLVAQTHCNIARVRCCKIHFNLWVSTLQKVASLHHKMSLLMPKSQPLLISIHRKCQIWIGIFIIIHFSFSIFFYFIFLFTFFYLLSLVEVAPSAQSLSSVRAATCLCFSACFHVKVFALDIIDCTARAAPYWLKMMEEELEGGKKKSFPSLFLLPLPHFFLIPLSRLQGIHRESQMISFKVSLQQMLLLRAPRTFTLCRQKVRRINQAAARTSCAAEIQSGGEKTEFARGACWYLLSAGSRERLMTASPTAAICWLCEHLLLSVFRRDELRLVGLFPPQSSVVTTTLM